MKFEFILEFSTEESDSLWSQGVCLDDYDYAIITYDLEHFEETDDLELEDHWDDIKKEYKTVAVPSKLLSPKDYTVSRLLTGCCDNTWYRIKWNNKDAIIGLAYHA